MMPEWRCDTGGQSLQVGIACRPALEYEKTLPIVPARRRRGRDKQRPPRGGLCKIWRRGGLPPTCSQTCPFVYLRRFDPCFQGFVCFPLGHTVAYNARQEHGREHGRMAWLHKRLNPRLVASSTVAGYYADGGGLY